MSNVAADMVAAIAQVQDESQALGRTASASVGNDDRNDDLGVCRELLRGGSRSFFAASYLLPGRVAAPAAALYAFCRVADDAVDLGDGRQGLEDLQRRLERIYRGCPDDHCADRAFTEVVQAIRIPRDLPEALLDGFAWDVHGRDYETLSDVIAYGARVAGTVGAMMTLVMGARAAPVLARACDLGAAMQLTNIARDVGEDAQNGRFYLPRAWMREAGLDPEAWLAAPTFSPALGSVVERLLDTAEHLYRRATTGIAELPLRCRAGIHAARLLYAEIGRELARNGLDSVSVRTVVPLRRKLRLCADALAATATRGPTRLDAPPLPETRFLVEAVHPGVTGTGEPGATTEQTLAQSMEAEIRGWPWVIQLFARMELRERVGSAPVIGQPDAEGATAD